MQEASATVNYMQDTTALGMRDRKKAERRQRIMAVADELFASKGVKNTSTDEIARAADVGQGTLFRNFATKAELLIAVMNDHLTSGVARARGLATAGASPEDAVYAVVEPLVRASDQHPENTAEYQKEIFFGGGDGPARAEALALVAEIEDCVVQILRAAVRRPSTDLASAAHTILSACYSDILRTSLAEQGRHNLPERLRGHVRVVVNGIRG